MSLFFAFFSGAIFMLMFQLYRIMGNNGFDSSNITNAIRLLIHVILHTEDFGKMWYLDDFNNPTKRPFHYIGKDELSEVVRTRP
jgi:hypothetical protein